MLLIFGTRVRTKLLRAVVFFCSGCGGDRQGRLLEARQWFTLFFIPIIPMKRLGEVVQCDTCGRQYRPDVLERPTTAAIGDVLTNAVRAINAMLVAVGDRTDAALRGRAVGATASMVPGYADDTLDTDLAALDPDRAAEYVAPLADTVAPAGRERFLADAVRVAGVPLGSAQRRIIDECGRGLGLSPAHVAGIVATTVPTPGETGSTPPAGEA